MNPEGGSTARRRVHRQRSRRSDGRRAHCKKQTPATRGWREWDRAKGQHCSTNTGASYVNCVASAFILNRPQFAVRVVTATSRRAVAPILNSYKKMHLFLQDSFPKHGLGEFLALKLFWNRNKTQIPKIGIETFGTVPGGKYFVTTPKFWDFGRYFVRRWRCSKLKRICFLSTQKGADTRFFHLFPSTSSYASYHFGRVAGAYTDFCERRGSF
jgi:hypothetical protein